MDLIVSLLPVIVQFYTQMDLNKMTKEYRKYKRIRPVMWLIAFSWFVFASATFIFCLGHATAEILTALK